jgi:hypothetical protein
MSLKLLAGLLTMTLNAGFVMPAAAQEVLPFPPKPSGSTAARTMQESIYSPLPPVNHLPKDAPNILVVLIDDVGPAQTDTYGGEIHTRAHEFCGDEKRRAEEKGTPKLRMPTP